jgi:hypothetical protein
MPPPLRNARPTPQIGPDIAQQVRSELGPVVGTPELRAFFAARRHEWHLPKTLRFTKFVESLINNTEYIEVELHSEIYMSMKRYSYGEPNPYVLGTSLRKDSYLSHGSALELHGLATPNATVYVNKEQTVKPPPGGGLSQKSIDRAFAGKGRVSRYVLEWNDYSFVLLNGKSTSRFQVENMQVQGGATIDVTGLSRTLVDAAVRPAYCGGIQVVANAYRAAKPKASAKSILDTLGELNYAYPYHQAIGFYMQCAGYGESELDLVRALNTGFDFYLGNAMLQPKYSTEWKVYYPAALS